MPGHVILTAITFQRKMRLRQVTPKMSAFSFSIRTEVGLFSAIQTFGFLPLFRNSIPGFSIEEHAAPSAWFSYEPGVWQWKGPVIQRTGCAYGKFFEKKAAFVSAEWFPDLANYRRDGYVWDAE